MAIWNGLFAWPVVMLIADFFLKLKKWQGCNWATARKDLLLDSVHRTLKLLLHKELFNSCLFKVQQSLTQYLDWIISCCCCCCCCCRHCHCHWWVPAAAAAATGRCSPVYSNCINIKCIVCPNCTQFYTVLSWAFYNTHTKCEVNQMNDSPDMGAIVRQTQISVIIRLIGVLLFALAIVKKSCKSSRQVQQIWNWLTDLSKNRLTLKHLNLSY